MTDPQRCLHSQGDWEGQEFPATDLLPWSTHVLSFALCTTMGEWLGSAAINWSCSWDHSMWWKWKAGEEYYCFQRTVSWYLNLSQFNLPHSGELSVIHVDAWIFSISLIPSSLPRGCQCIGVRSIGPNRLDPCWLWLRCLGLLVSGSLLPSSLNPLLGHVLASVVAFASGLKVLALGSLITPSPGLFSPSYLFCDSSHGAWGLLECLQILDQPWRSTRAVSVSLSSPLPVITLRPTR